MSSRRVLGVVVTVGTFLLLLSSVFPAPARAAWVNGAGTQFQVGGQLTQIIPTAAGTSFADPTCGQQGGTSLALVPGLKLAGVDPVLYPIVLVVSCLDNGGSNTVRARLNFINPADGKVIKQLSTTAVPSNGWAHLIHRPDKGDLLGCGSDGSLYSIDFSQATTTPDGTATALPQVASSCAGLAWDAEADMIYQGLTVSGGTKIGRVVRFKDGTTTVLGDFTNLPCGANGLAISGGVLLMSCNGTLTIRRLDKSTGQSLGVHALLSATGLSPLNSDPGLGDLACDPVTFRQDANRKDMFRDGMWARRGDNGNGVVALEFPAFTCGMPSNSVVNHPTLGPISPLAAGLSGPDASGQPGAIPLAACFDTSGTVKDLDGDGLPDCWEGASTSNGIDFSGRGGIDIQLCVFADTNGDGIPDTQECADPTHRDLFVEIDWMQNHKPDPKALSQTQSVAAVGVQSVREAFAAAPVQNPLSIASPSNGIRIHFQVDEQVTFNPLVGPPTSHVSQVAFTPCTGPANSALSVTDAVDFDVVKAANFGTSTERGSVNSANILNAKRLAFRYVLFAHNLVGNPSGGSNGSGCAEVGGDDAVVTLGSFVTTIVDGISHPRGTTDQQAGTFMHELGHTFGFRHGGPDGNNCKPNYRSVMSYPRQFAGSPIANRRLDYSRSADPVLPLSPTLTGFLDEAHLNEFDALGADPSLGPIPVYFPSADQIAYGPTAWSVVTPTAAPINWNRSVQGKNPSFQTDVAANINTGATTGCDGSGTVLVGQNDWDNILYRTSAAIDFGSGGRSETPIEMTSDHEKAFFLAKDVDGNGVGDGSDCGFLFPCTHRIDIKPSFPFPKTINPGTEANLTVAIFSEKNGSHVWDAAAQVMLNDLANFPLTFSVGSFVVSVKVNNKGGGTCSVSDVPDPLTGIKDGIKDLKCQFGTGGLPTGTHFGIVSGFFFDPLETNPDVSPIKAFSARQEVTIVSQ
jgi:hypothetical protein